MTQPLIGFGYTRMLVRSYIITDSMLPCIAS